MKVSVKQKIHRILANVVALLSSRQYGSLFLINLGSILNILIGLLFGKSTSLLVTKLWICPTHPLKPIVKDSIGPQIRTRFQLSQTNQKSTLYWCFFFVSPTAREPPEKPDVRSKKIRRDRREELARWREGGDGRAHGDAGLGGHRQG